MMPELPPLRPDQQKIADHAARFKIVACGRRWGKTTLGLWMAVQAARDGKRVWWVAPSYGLAFYPWRILKSATADLREGKLESERHIDLPGGGSLTVKSADDPDSLRGVGLDLVIVDEAAFVSEEAWTACLRPALSDRLGKALIISTPRGRNWFWYAFQRGKAPDVKDWYSWQAPTIANPHIEAQEVEEARALLPERIFRQEYEAAFLEDGSTVFRGVEAAATAPPDAEPVPGHTYFAGVDFGRYEDFTAVAVIDASTQVMVALDRFSEVSWEIQRARIATTARRWRVDAVLAEANAMGEPNIEALRQAGLPVMSFVTTSTSKTSLIENLVKAIESREIALLPDPALIGELQTFTYKYTSYGTQYHAPAGHHDDTVIALGLAWRLVAQPRLAFGIAEVCGRAPIENGWQSRADPHQRMVLILQAQKANGG